MDSFDECNASRDEGTVKQSTIKASANLRVSSEVNPITGSKGLSGDFNDRAAMSDMNNESFKNGTQVQNKEGSLQFSQTQGQSPVPVVSKEEVLAYSTTLNSNNGGLNARPIYT